MKQSLAHVTLVVRDYDEAIRFYVDRLGFRLIEDTYQPAQDKRWVVIAPPGSEGDPAAASILLARASNERQSNFVGDQTGGRVFLFLRTDDFRRDYDRLRAAGVEFVREPMKADYGEVAVFLDLYGNRWDLVQFRSGNEHSNPGPTTSYQTSSGPGPTSGKGCSRL